MNGPLVIARTVAATAAEGPHRRFALWLAGCSIRCPGCCNPELFDRNAGRSVPVDSIVAMIAEAAAQHDIEGITILGGEPLEQLEATASLCAAVSQLGLGIVVFTGHTIARARTMPGFDRLWDVVDTFVDGPFDASHREPRGGRRYIGSTNQCLVHRTDRYDDPDLWHGSNHAEIRVARDGTTSVHGDPATVRSLLRSWGA